MSMYGGYEQVGSIGQSLSRDDKQTTTSSGDIVLYSGNQMLLKILFYLLQKLFSNRGKCLILIPN